MATFVLVHGAWHGGWCYERVARLLRAGGHDVYTPTLTGLGERSHLVHGGAGLRTHVQDIVNVVRWEDLSTIVLCGHSYGGMVVTGVADALADRIASLVYLDAFLPEDGDSLWDLTSEESRRAYLEGARTVDGRVVIPPKPAAAFGVNAADRSWVDGRCTPMPLAALTEKLRLTGSHLRVGKRTYILAEGYGRFRPVYERLQGDASWSLKTVPCGHDVMVDMPETLAKLLLDAA